MRGLLIWSLVFSLAATSSCSKGEGLRSKQAVQAAIEEHLKQNRQIQLENFTTEIEEVKLQGDTAEALVKYRSKESPELTVQVRYSLRKTGDHWEVRSSSPAGGQAMNPHGSMGTPAPAPTQKTPGLQSSH